MVMVVVQVMNWTENTVEFVCLLQWQLQHDNMALKPLP